jgi:ppGpp synthetase/RelA/SpoT-type nucleotidyltranferase
MTNSKTEIDKAGNILKDKESYSDAEIANAEKTLTYWRTIHSSVITDFHSDLKKRVININKNAVIVQRIKRTESIIRKLNRISGMRLSRMQDIAGVRVIVNSIDEVYLLMDNLLHAEFLHEFKNKKDYIQEPKDSGYRGIHIIYKYNNQSEKDANGLYIEIQIRTKLQHIWATAVETMSTFLGTHLKFNEGQQKWLKYFALTSSAYSFIEKTPQVPKYDKYTEKDTLEMAIYEYNYNKINESLSAYSVAADFICKKVEDDKKYHIVTLDTLKRVVNVLSFSEAEIDIANEKYTQIENEFKEIEHKQSVLVSTDSIHELKNGFPNYFLDIREFLSQMDLIKARLIKYK